MGTTSVVPIGVSACQNLRKGCLGGRQAAVRRSATGAQDQCTRSPQPAGRRRAPRRCGWPRRRLHGRSPGVRWGWFRGPPWFGRRRGSVRQLVRRAPRPGWCGCWPGVRRSAGWSVPVLLRSRGRRRSLPSSLRGAARDRTWDGRRCWWSLRRSGGRRVGRDCGSGQPFVRRAPGRRVPVGRLPEQFRPADRRVLRRSGRRRSSGRGRRRAWRVQWFLRSRPVGRSRPGCVQWFLRCRPVRSSRPRRASGRRSCGIGAIRVLRRAARRGSAPRRF
jgi:hypothetical protein